VLPCWCGRVDLFVKLGATAQSPPEHTSCLARRRAGAAVFCVVAPPPYLPPTVKPVAGEELESEGRAPVLCSCVLRNFAS
jgi:hypothetical protein